MTHRALLILISMLSASVSAAGRYDEALSKAKDAALIQSGVQAEADKAKRQLEAYGLFQATRLGVEKPVTAMLYCTKAYVDKAVSFPIDSNKRIRLELDRAGITIDF